MKRRRSRRSGSTRSRETGLSPGPARSFRLPSYRRRDRKWQAGLRASGLAAPRLSSARQVRQALFQSGRQIGAQHWPFETPMMRFSANSRRNGYVVRTLCDGFRDRDRRPDLWCVPRAHARTLDVVGAVVLLGVGILTGVKATRQRDPASLRLTDVLALALRALERHWRTPWSNCKDEPSCSYADPESLCSILYTYRCE